jgi:hypothetical protein
VTLSYGGATVATLNMPDPESSDFLTRPDGSGDTIVYLAGTRSFVGYALTADDHAMRADAARASFTDASGRPVTGIGARIGIISDSFNSVPATAPTIRPMPRRSRVICPSTWRPAHPP